MIYLDNAATTGKKPPEVISAVNRALNELSYNPGRGGHSPSVKAAEAVYSVRKKVASFFAAKGAERVIFTPSCTYSLNFVVKGIMHRGDHIIISSMEHNAVYRPVETLRKMGAEVDIAEVIFGDSEATVRSFKRIIKKNTRAIVLMHGSNVTGEIFPIEALGEVCNEKGILFVVDGAQSAGLIPIDMKKMHIDYLAVAPHKGMYAPMGTGILIANKDIPFPIIEGGTGSQSALPYLPEEYPERMESGTLNLPGIMGISAGIDFISKKGMDRMYRAEMGLVDRLYSGLKKIPNVQIYSEQPHLYKSLPVLSFNVKGKDSSRVAEYLNNKGIAVRAGLHCAALAHKRLGTVTSGTVRVSPSVFNTVADIDALLSAVKFMK